MEPRNVPGERVVKRYANRKLYDNAAGRYVTLEDLAAHVAEGGELHVVDARTGEDLTAVVLAQVLLEGVKQRSTAVPRQVFTRLIRLGAAQAPALPDLSASHEAAARARDEAERIVAGLLARGRLSLDEALALRQEIAGSVQRLVGDAQRGLEGRLRRLLDRAEREEGVAASLHTLRDRLLSFESWLGEPQQEPTDGAAGKPPRQRPRPKRTARAARTRRA